MLNGASVTILVLIFVYFVGGSEGQCPSWAWQYINGQCYYVEISQKTTWDESKVFCEKQGGHLLKLTSKNYDDINKKLLSFASWNQPDFVWVGGKYDENCKELRWTDSSSVDLTYAWAPYEPPSYCFNEKGRLMLVSAAIKYQLRCSDYGKSRYAFICEFNPSA